MAAQFNEVSPDAPLGAKALNWLDNRFPASKLYKEHLGEYYAPKNFNIWYVVGSDNSDRHWHLSNDELQAGCGVGLCIG